MHTFQVVLFTCLSLFSAHAQRQTPNYFEGKIVYEMFGTEKSGRLTPSKEVGRQEYYFKDVLVKFEIIEGRYMQLGEIVVNTQDTTRFNVNHYKKMVTPLGPEPHDASYFPKEITFVHAEDTILGYPCKKYKVLQKDFYSGRDLISYLWVAESLEVMNLPLLGEIFGYRNTLFKDGSLGGIALKYESLNPDGSVNLVVKATEVFPMKLEQSHFAIPTAYFRVRVK